MFGPFWSLLKTNSTLVRPGLLSHAAVYGSNAIGLLYFLKHTLFLKHFKGYCEKHGNYGPEEPADELNDTLSDIISKDLKDMASENTPIALYLTDGLETTHLGTIGTVTGGFVGLPAFYEFKKEQDILDNILVKAVSYNETNDQEKESYDCFLLSDKAKKYGIAREVLSINTLHVYFNAFLPFAVSTLVVVLLKDIPEHYHFHRYPLYKRGLIYTAVTIFGFGFWRYLYKKVINFYESEVERQIAELGMDYLEGGIEYCTKEVQRNSLSVEIKNEKLRILKAINDLICKLIPSDVTAQKRLEYLQALKNKNVE